MFLFPLPTSISVSQFLFCMFWLLTKLTLCRRYMSQEANASSSLLTVYYTVYASLLSRTRNLVLVFSLLYRITASPYVCVCVCACSRISVFPLLYLSTHGSTFLLFCIITVPQQRGYWGHACKTSIHRTTATTSSPHRSPAQELRQPYPFSPYFIFRWAVFYMA